MKQLRIGFAALFILPGLILSPPLYVLPAAFMRRKRTVFCVRMDTLLVVPFASSSVSMCGGQSRERP